MLLFLFCTMALARLPTPRLAFYSALAVGVGVYGPQLAFFWSLFGPPAVTLWIVLAFWLALFVLLLHLSQRRFGPVWAAILAPFLWTGIEYFRSELYVLRFAWLTPGFALSGSPQMTGLSGLGIYGVGFCLAALAAGLSLLPPRSALVSLASVTAILLTAALGWPRLSHESSSVEKVAHVAGIQVEFPVELEVPRLLDQAVRKCPEAEIMVLSEYTFDGPVPKPVKQWCRKNQRYLVAGGKEVVDAKTFYNTAFVIGPSGDIVFQQAKSVPIQFFKDGSPARERKLWESPWGKIGVCICYDLSYSRVTDDLVRQGAQALLVPTMDVADWGRHEHELHARVAPIRAAEYGLPIFRLASSGVSQLVAPSGAVCTSLRFPAQEAILTGELRPVPHGRIPLDRFLAPAATALTAVVVVVLAVPSLLLRLRSRSVSLDTGAAAERIVS